MSNIITRCFELAAITACVAWCCGACRPVVIDRTVTVTGAAAGGDGDDDSVTSVVPNVSLLNIER